MKRARLILTGLAFSVAAVVAPARADINDYTADLKASVTVTGATVTLGDLFEGDIMRPEKAIAKAPEPGKRFVLGAKWLADVARTYGIDWRPTSTYDRATVFRPGQTISQSEILEHVRDSLIDFGLPSNYGLEVTTPLSNVTISTEVAAEVGVREAFFNDQTRVFSAVVEIPRGTPNAQFIPIRGIAFPTVSVPTVDRSVRKNTIITDSMIQWVDVSEDKIRHDTIMDARLLVGKSPRSYLRAGDAVRNNDVMQMSLVDIPVPTHDLREDTKISTAHIEWVTVNQSDLAKNVIINADRLIGMSPRRFLPAGAPIRTTDVHTVVPIDVPVALRDIRRGTVVSIKDFHWITMNEHDLNGDVIVDDIDIEGLMARRTIRSGQIFRNRDLRTQVVVARGQAVNIVLRTPFLQLSAKGKALENGGANEIIKVINTLSDKAVYATIVDGDTVRVESQQTAMQ